MGAAFADQGHDRPRPMLTVAKLPAALEFSAQKRAPGDSRRQPTMNAGSAAAGDGDRPMSRWLPKSLQWSISTAA
jgi:hypothetical protein